MKDIIRGVLAESGRLPTPVDSLADDDDLYGAGLSSHASVSVMLGLEEAFDVEFPDEMLTRAVFGSIEAMALALSALRPAASA